MPSDAVTGSCASAQDPDRVRRWFDRRTHTAGDFSQDALEQVRRETGVTVSCVLPARNEEATVGGVVEAAVALRPGLLDEVLVVDGRSTDATARVAAAAGARVIVDADLPPGPPCLGKGDALWRSLIATHGDLVVFCDTDIRNPSPTFFTGLLGPLLTDADVHFVKAFSDRPLEAGGALQPTGGGRVTELTARPLLNLHWPALAGLAQPLSGEYAGRRRALESVPFFTGYGVEFGLVVDMAARYGVDAIAQVDIGRRVHRNQPLPALSRMAHAIHLVALERLTWGGRTQDRPRDGAPVDAIYRQIGRDHDGRPALATTTTTILERPPHRP